MLTTLLTTLMATLVAALVAAASPTPPSPSAAAFPPSLAALATL